MAEEEPSIVIPHAQLVDIVLTAMIEGLLKQGLSIGQILGFMVGRGRREMESRMGRAEAIDIDRRARVAIGWEPANLE